MRQHLDFSVPQKKKTFHTVILAGRRESSGNDCNKNYYP